jgi:DNA repair protein RecN (Recombination protein N)
VVTRLRVENLVLIREAELELPAGLIAVTGETGAGKTIFTQAIGLLLGARGDAAFVGPAGSEAYVEAELELPDELLALDELASIAELRPDDADRLVVARRVFEDGRSRAYAWGKVVPRDDVGALVERAVAMSGQFEQRRLARASHRLALLDAFAGSEQWERLAACAAAWRELRRASQEYDRALSSSADHEAHVAELQMLVEATDGLTPELEAELLGERERLGRSADLVQAAAGAAEALSAEGEGPSAALALASAEQALAAVEGVAAELDAVRSDVRAAGVTVAEAAMSLRSFLASEQSDPSRLEQIGEQLQRIADTRRRFGVEQLDELLERARLAAVELDEEAAGGLLERAEARLATAEAAFEGLSAALNEARAAAAEPYAAAAREELRALGLGTGELVVELVPRDPGPSGVDEVSFLVRTNKGMPLASVASAASGGELSRIALALRAVAHEQAGEETVVFDEIDAGVGGTTAHAVAGSLQRLADRAQVIAITHLPQIASVAATHLRVSKVPGDPDQTRIELLDDDERQAELERMLGGAEFVESLTGGEIAPPSA